MNQFNQYFPIFKKRGDNSYLVFLSKFITLLSILSITLGNMVSTVQ